MASNSHKSTNRTLIVVISAVVVGIVGLAALLAVLLTGDSKSDADQSSSSAPLEVDLEATRPVTVDGASLPPVAEQADPAAGAAAPILNGSDFAGTPVTVAADGRPTLLVFMAHWCPHCNREVPRLVSWQESGRVPEELQVMAISTGVLGDAPNYPPYTWLSELNWTWPVLADSGDKTAAQAFGVDGFPYFVMLQPDGTVAARFSGEVEPAVLEQLLTQYLGLSFS
jgi:thiol-disulfide isomerase/thioredoxin